MSNTINHCFGAASNCISVSGDLNFANIVQEDEQNGKGYACEIWNDVMRRQQRGSFYRIKPLKGTLQNL